MSAHFILRFAEHPLREVGRALVVCEEREATSYVSEADAWLAAHSHALRPISAISVTQPSTSNQQPATPL